MLAFSLALLIGFSLGLLGGGGSILTVPVLIYLLGMEAKTSIALSLAIVGITSLIGVIKHYRLGNVDFRAIMLFAPLSMIGAVVGARLSNFLNSQTQLIIFAIVMLAASVLMIRGRKEVQVTEGKISPMPLMIAGFAVGILSGVVGVGGGFLIVPALVLIAKRPMRVAVGSSLAVISLSALSGFAGYLGQLEIPWLFLGQFILFSSIGIVLGGHFSQKVPQDRLKKIFGIFLIFMGIFILYKNLS